MKNISYSLASSLAVLSLVGCSQVMFSPTQVAALDAVTATDPVTIVVAPTPAPTPVPTPLPVAAAFHLVTDTKTMPSVAKMDLLFVVDYTMSMYQNLESISTKLAGLSGQLQDFDWQMAITTSGMGDSSLINTFNQYGKLLPYLRNYDFYPSLKTIWTSADDYFDYYFYWTLTNPEPDTCTNGAWCETSAPESLKSTIAAINLAKTSDTGFFRSGSYFVPVIISNSDENYIGGVTVTQGAAVVAAYNTQLAPTMAGMLPVDIGIQPGDAACLAAQQQTSVQSVFGHAQAANVTSAFVESMGGVSISICDANYTPAFTQVDTHIRMNASFIDLTAVPVNTQPIVTMTPAPAVAIPWTLTGQRITFSQALPKNTVVTVSYQAAGGQ